MSKHHAVIYAAAVLVIAIEYSMTIRIVAIITAIFLGMAWLASRSPFFARCFTGFIAGLFIGDRYGRRWWLGGPS
jgi:hypothetical protein